MSFWGLFMLGISVAMDAFAVSISKGIAFKHVKVSNALIIAFYFGIFQWLMPVLGYYLASHFSDKIITWDHWIAFALLGFIGIKMIKDSRKASSDNINIPAYTRFSHMLPLAIATSIDALAIGVSLAFLKEKIIPAASIMGIVTFILAFCGVFAGSAFGLRYKAKAEVLGGIILVLISLKILFEHLGILNF